MRDAGTSKCRISKGSGLGFPSGGSREKRPRGEDPKFLHRRGKGEVGGLAGGEPGEELGRRIGTGDWRARRVVEERQCVRFLTGCLDPHAVYPWGPTCTILAATR